MRGERRGGKSGAHASSGQGEGGGGRTEPGREGGREGGRGGGMEQGREEVSHSGDRSRAAHVLAADMPLSLAPVRTAREAAKAPSFRGAPHARDAVKDAGAREAREVHRAPPLREDRTPLSPDREALKPTVRAAPMRAGPPAREALRAHGPPPREAPSGPPGKGEPPGREGVRGDRGRDGAVGGQGGGGRRGRQVAKGGVRNQATCVGVANVAVKFDEPVSKSAARASGGRLVDPACLKTPCWVGRLRVVGRGGSWAEEVTVMFAVIMGPMIELAGDTRVARAGEDAARVSTWIKDEVKAKRQVLQAPLTHRGSFDYD